MYLVSNAQTGAMIGQCPTEAGALEIAYHAGARGAPQRDLRTYEMRVGPGQKWDGTVDGPTAPRISAIIRQS